VGRNPYPEYLEMGCAGRNDRFLPLPVSALRRTHKAQSSTFV